MIRSIEAVKHLVSPGAVERGKLENQAAAQCAILVELAAVGSRAIDRTAVVQIASSPSGSAVLFTLEFVKDIHGIGTAVALRRYELEDGSTAKLLIAAGAMQSAGRADAVDRSGTIDK